MAGGLRVVGSGHSFTDLGVTRAIVLVLNGQRRVLEIRRLPEGGAEVKVEAGVPLWRLNHALAALGLALPNLGDIERQTVAGAISTGTHGTGAELGGLATFVTAFELVTASGEVLRASAEEEPEVFRCGRVALGALGVLATVTLRCVPAFELVAEERPERVDRVMEGFEAEAEAHRHFELYWVPHTGWALTKRNNPASPETDAPVRSKWHTLRDEVLLPNLAFGAVCRVGRRLPSLVPRLATAVPSTGAVCYRDRSDRVFTSPRYVRFVEMEYRFPRHLTADALDAVRRVVDEKKLRVSFPVEVRVSAADDIPLSMGFGGDSGWVAVHMYKGVDHRPYFEAVEQAWHDLAGVEARPHWGKLHTLTAAELAPRYPEWDAFQSVRRRLDPNGLFTSPAVGRVLGSV
jgi:L-gulono-1,4-lactone dehydrogenase